MSDRLEQLTKLHDADPADPFCAYAIALEHAKAEQFDQALTWFDKTLSIDASYCYAYYHKAKTLAQMGSTADAQTLLRTGIEVAKQAGDDHAESEMIELLEALD